MAEQQLREQYHHLSSMVLAVEEVEQPLLRDLLAAMAAMPLVLAAEEVAVGLYLPRLELAAMVGQAREGS